MIGVDQPSITFTVLGEPQPQGSTRSFVVAGKAVTTSANANLRPWRTDLTLSALQAAKTAPTPLSGAVIVRCDFALRRPKSVKRAWPSTRPDLDKLQRALGDALVAAGILRDDGQIVVWFPTKRFADDPDCPIDHPGVMVTVTALEAQ